MAGTRASAKRVLQIERDAIAALISKIDARFDRACDLIVKSKGRVVVLGMGKPGFIAQKISATLSSTGTASFFLHPGEALHGDLGRVVREDVVVALSNSGRTEEIVKLLPLIKKIGAKLVAMTGDLKSPLARYADVTLDVSVRKEACSMNLAPTASTTAMLAMGDALAVALLERKGFQPKDFAFYHPGGTLGKRLLLRAQDLMRTGRDNPVVRENEKLSQVLVKITKSRAGSATVVGKDGRLTGIFTDGDLRRHLKAGEKILDSPLRDVMTKRPVTLPVDALAAEALAIMQGRKIDEIPVVDAKGRPAGLLDVQDLLRAGLV